MPNKTIYVSDDDLPLYTKAQELAGGNLSSAIVSALRRYVEIEEGRREGFDEISLHVGPGHGRLVKFSGTLIGEWANSTSSSVAVYRIYRGRTGKFAVHTERTPEYFSRDAEGKEVTGWRSWLGIGVFSWGQTPGESTLDVYDDLEAMRGKIPAPLFEMVETAVGHPAVEELDI